MLGRSGKVIEQGTVQDVLKMDPKLRKQVELEKAEADTSGKETDDMDKPDDGKGKLVVPEEKAIGRVEFAAIKLYLAGVGGPLMWAGYICFLWGGILLDVSRTWYVGYWSSQYEGKDPTEVDSHK
jgi:hypothetical protein